MDLGINAMVNCRAFPESDAAPAAGSEDLLQLVESNNPAAASKAKNRGVVCLKPGGQGIANLIYGQALDRIRETIVAVCPVGKKRRPSPELALGR